MKKTVILFIVLLMLLPSAVYAQEESECDADNLQKVLDYLGEITDAAKLINDAESAGDFAGAYITLSTTELYIFEDAESWGACELTIAVPLFQAVAAGKNVAAFAIISQVDTANEELHIKNASSSVQIMSDALDRAVELVDEAIE